MGKLLCEKIYGTFVVEMREIGQKLVKFCTHTQVTVTVFKTSRHSKLLFFVKKQRTMERKSGPKVGDGKVAMWKKFTGRLVSKWERTGRNWSNFANTHTHTHARVSYSSIDRQGRSTIFCIPIYPMLKQWNANSITPNPGLWLVESTEASYAYWWEHILYAYLSNVK